jgi:hypothetical protein
MCRGDSAAQARGRGGKGGRLIRPVRPQHLTIPLHAQLEQFIREWNMHAHPFNWSTKSGAKVMAAAPTMTA